MGKNLYSLISYASVASSIRTSLLSADKTNSFGNFGSRVNLGHVLLARVCLRTFCGILLKRKSMEKLWKCYGLRAHADVESIW